MGIKVEKKEKPVKENLQDRKIEIFLDNLCLKLGLHDKKDIIGMLQKKINDRVEVKWLIIHFIQKHRPFHDYYQIK